MSELPEGPSSPPPPEPTRPDGELVAAALRDPDAYAVIVELYETALIRFVHGLSRLNHMDAEDLVQKTFLNAYLHLNDFDRKLRLSTWLFRIARNEVIDHWRRSTARPVEHELSEQAVDDSVHHDENYGTRVDRAYLSEEVRQTLDLLKATSREVLYLYYFEERSYDEIADIIRKSPGTVASLISRAKKEFSACAARTNVDTRFLAAL